MRAAPWIVALGLPALAAAAAEGQRPRVQLSFSPDAPAACPEPAELRAWVAERLGYDPVDDAATRHLTVAFRPRGRALVATITSAEGAAPPRVRELRSDTGDCQELGRAVALALSVAIDPESLVRTPSAASAAGSDGAPPPSASATGTAARPPAPPTSASAEPASSTAPPPIDRGADGGEGRRDPSRPDPGRDPGAPPDGQGAWRVSALAGARVALGSAPAPQLGLGLHLGVEREVWSLGVEPWWFLEQRVARGEGRGFTVGAVGAAMVPCFHAAPAQLCAFGEVLRLEARGLGVDVPAGGAATFLRLGVSAGLALELTPGFAVGARAEGWAVPAPVELTLDGASTYRQAPAGGGLAAFLGGSL